MTRQASPRLPHSGGLTVGNYALRTAELYDDIADWYVDSFWDDETDSDWIALCLSALEGRRTVADIGSGPGTMHVFSRMLVMK